MEYLKEKNVKNTKDPLSRKNYPVETAQTQKE